MKLWKLFIICDKKHSFKFLFLSKILASKIRRNKQSMHLLRLTPLTRIDDDIKIICILKTNFRQ